MIQYLRQKTDDKKLICKDAAQMVIPYIKKELSNAQLRRFVAHIKECPDCREELETYYIVYKGLMQLDKNEEIPMNIVEALNDELHVSDQHLIHVSLFCVFSEIVKWLVNICCTFLLVEIFMKMILGV